MGSFGILKGPVEHLKSMFQADRLYFTFLYFGSMFVTLYATFSFGGASGYLLVMSASAAQLVGLLWYLISFLPGGASGLKYVAAAMGHMLNQVLDDGDGRKFVKVIYDGTVWSQSLYTAARHFYCMLFCYKLRLFVVEIR
jgi:hypothetical protein